MLKGISKVVFQWVGADSKISVATRKRALYDAQRRYLHFGAVS